MARSILIGCVFASLAAACSGAPSSDGADYDITNAPPRSPAPAPTTDDPGADVTPPADPPATTPPPPSAKPAVAYEGKLAATAAVPFGGGTYCKYDVTLKSIIVDLSVSDAGDFESATMHDVMNEATVGTCPYAAMAPSNQTFTSTKATKTATGFHIEFAGGKDNRPVTSLVVDVVMNGASYDATATWKRTDIGAPLAWTVTAKVTLAKKAAT